MHVTHKTMHRFSTTHIIRGTFLGLATYLHKHYDIPTSFIASRTAPLHFCFVPHILHTFLPLSSPGWRGIVVTVGAGGCQTCGTHISVTAGRIFSIRSCEELSRPLIVHCHGHLPICPIWLYHGPKHVEFVTNWVQTLRIAYL